jgi:hypothetical protein
MGLSNACPPLTITLFPNRTVDMSLKDDVTVILLLCVSVMAQGLYFVDFILNNGNYELDIFTHICLHLQNKVLMKKNLTKFFLPLRSRRIAV